MIQMQVIMYNLLTSAQYPAFGTASFAQTIQMNAMLLITNIAFCKKEKILRFHSWNTENLLNFVAFLRF